jgi:hypothetical protein
LAFGIFEELGLRVWLVWGRWVFGAKDDKEGEEFRRQRRGAADERRTWGLSPTFLHNFLRMSFVEDIRE